MATVGMTTGVGVDGAPASLEPDVPSDGFVRVGEPPATVLVGTVREVGVDVVVAVPVGLAPTATGVSAGFTPEPRVVGETATSPLASNFIEALWAGYTAPSPPPSAVTSRKSEPLVA